MFGNLTKPSELTIAMVFVEGLVSMMPTVITHVASLAYSTVLLNATVPPKETARRFATGLEKNMMMVIVVVRVVRSTVMESAMET